MIRLNYLFCTRCYYLLSSSNFSLILNIRLSSLMHHFISFTRILYRHPMSIIQLCWISSFFNSFESNLSWWSTTISTSTALPIISNFRNWRFPFLNLFIHSFLIYWRCCFNNRRVQVTCHLCQFLSKHSRF
jgi:hypothetical protein